MEETLNFEKDGKSLVIHIEHDQDAGNPLEEWDEMGEIISLNRRHRSFNADRVHREIEGNPDAVALSYYEHGNCLWSVYGELPAGADSWDSVDIAGVWVPDSLTLESAGTLEGITRKEFMQNRAREACEVYTQWCNGEVYGYRACAVTVCECCGTRKEEKIESCWGFYGYDDCREAAMRSIGATT